MYLYKGGGNDIYIFLYVMRARTWGFKYEVARHNKRADFENTFTVKYYITITIIR